MRLQKLQIILLITVFALSTALQPAHALIKMNQEGIRLALKYGMQNSGLGLYTLLGPNWIEGADGALLNIYTPFMMLASKAARGGYPTNPSSDDIKAAKKRYARVIRNFRSVRDPALVKFSVSMYGDNPSFAYSSIARIEGIGRGKRFKLKPKRSIKQKVAEAIPGTDFKPYEAINSYYFEFEPLYNMDEFKLIIEDPRKKGPERVILTFNVRKDRIY